MRQKSQPKIVIVHDWLTNMGGAENVVLAFHAAFPKAPIYTSTYIPENMPAFKGLDVRTTYLQNLPKPLRKLHKFFPMLRVKAFRKLDLSEFDVILSSSSAEAKQVRKTRPDQIHICYCHTPIRYYWSDYAEYKKNPGFGGLNWLVRLFMPIIVPPLRRADFKAAQAVDYFIGNSEYISERIKTFYKKPADVIHPPVTVKRFKPKLKRADYYVTMARHIPYKRLDLAVQAANKLGIKLKVFGDGSEHDRLVAMAGPTVEFFSGSRSQKDQDHITQSFNEARGFIFPAKEDFGITMVESLAGGTPVITYSQGGSLDIVKDGETGILFDNQTPEAVAEAIKRSQAIKFNPILLHNRAKRFDHTMFITKIKNYVASRAN